MKVAPSVRPSVRPSSTPQQKPRFKGDVGVVSIAMHDDPIVSDELRAPFPWFGGKRRVAALVWSRLGNVDTYNEPFFGSGAVLLARPQTPRVETINDLDCFVVNFWRSLKNDPEGVAYWADGPVNESDLHARHRWLVSRGRRMALRCTRDPHYFNAKVAGWWVWGQCLWIGSGWCQAPGLPPGAAPVKERSKPEGRSSPGDQGVISRHANGTNSELIPDWEIRPDLSAANGRGGVLTSQRTAKSRSGEKPSEQRKRFRSDGTGGVHAQKRFNSTGNGQGAGVHRRWQGGGQGGGSGVHAPTLAQQKPDLSGDAGAAGRGIAASQFDLRTGGLYAYLHQLAARLRRVRVCCGDWKRVLTPAVTTYIGICGVFLDPPYRHDLRERCYSEDHDISGDVRAWALEHGADPNMRIALCGYEGEHEMPATWECVPWKAHGGYSRTERGVANRDRERIWFSPHCLRPELPLFEGAGV